MPINDLRQKVALSGIVAALFFSFTYILVGALYFPFRMPAIESTTDKLVFAWQCMLFAVMPLAGGIVAVIVRTLLRPSTLDGEPVLDGSFLDIHMRFVRDTASNLMLFAPVLFNLAIVLDGELMRIVPVFTSWFILARLYYWAAYLISPPHRIFGAAATVAPILFFLVLCALLILKVL